MMATFSVKFQPRSIGLYSSLYCILEVEFRITSDSPLWKTRVFKLIIILSWNYKLDRTNQPENSTYFKISSRRKRTISTISIELLCYFMLRLIILDYSRLNNFNQSSVSQYFIFKIISFGLKIYTWCTFSIIDTITPVTVLLYYCFTGMQTEEQLFTSYALTFYDGIYILYLTVRPSDDWK